MKITDQVWEFAEPLVKACGCSLWDVEYVREGGEWFLRLFLDKEGGVDIDEHRLAQIALEVRRTLELALQSGGADLKAVALGDGVLFVKDRVDRAGHGLAVVDVHAALLVEVEPVLVKLYRPRDGQKEFPGRLVRYEDGAVTIEMRGREVTFDKAEVALVRLRVEF